MIQIHNKEQDDLNCFPIVCIHWRKPGHSKRIFCLWKWGLQVFGFRITSRYIHIGRGKHIIAWRDKLEFIFVHLT